MKESIIKTIADYLGYSQKDTIAISNKAPTRYRRYTIKKKKGGQRSIFHPSKQTKSLQYALIETILRHLPIDESAAGYIRGIKSPLLRNAKIHSNFPYTVRIDFSNFFPSIKPDDLIKTLKKHRKLSKEESSFVENVLFARIGLGDKALAIGAPSSPIVSNIAMFSIDKKIKTLARKTANESAYTRYADDIVFSTNKKGACKLFYIKVKSLLEKIKSPRLTINAKKTIFTSRGTRRTVTGLYICPDGKISLGRRNKRYIKKLLFDFKNNRLSSNEIKYLRGYLAYILDVEPDFYNRLAMKYTSELIEKVRRKPKPI